MKKIKEAVAAIQQNEAAAIAATAVAKIIAVCLSGDKYVTAIIIVGIAQSICNAHIKIIEMGGIKKIVEDAKKEVI